MDIRSAPPTPLRRGADVVPPCVCLNLPTHKQTVVYCSILLPGRRVRMGSAAVSGRNRPSPLSAPSSPSLWSLSYFWLQENLHPPPSPRQGGPPLSPRRGGGVRPTPASTLIGTFPWTSARSPRPGPTRVLAKKGPIPASAIPKHTEQHTGCWPRRNRPWYRTSRRKRRLRASYFRSPIHVREDPPSRPPRDPLSPPLRLSGRRGPRAVFAGQTKGTEIDHAGNAQAPRSL